MQTNSQTAIEKAPLKTPCWRDDIQVLLDEQTLQKRIAELGAQITRDYADGDLVVVAVLKGSYVFFADLMRHIELPVACEFIGISSYGDSTRTSGVVKLTHDVQQSVAGKDVLLVEDIIDSGLSMRYLIDSFSARRPRSLAVCTLLHKPSGTKVAVPIDYTGFEVPDAFVVGFGLDYLGRLRNLPFVGTLTHKRAKEFKEAFDNLGQKRVER